ncbi:DUF4126 domain-containing protein [Methylobacter luteus]|uniref:DUF4126 domain-containing protein n=1 Tax=Methylobacter luteus TaxID=415 RepID=UPI0003F900B2|nr:DUF4126 domain-containing protein [Methylobacter luteus]
MEALDQISTTLALTMGLAWASGINLYATLFTLGYLANTGNLNLPPDLQIVANPMVMGAAGVMYFIEFFADKMPGVDTGWDTIHTFIRIPAGAMLAAGTVGDLNPAVELAAAILGGGLAAGTHATKAGTRVLINTSPEPFTNWFASVGEDVAVIGGVWACINHPVLFLIALVLFVLLMVWLLPRLWIGIKKVFRFIIRLFRREESPLNAGSSE